LVNRSQTNVRVSSSKCHPVRQSAEHVSLVGPQYDTDANGVRSRFERLTGVGPVAIHPTNEPPSHTQNGCRIRVRGRSFTSTVATVAHTMRWAISTNAGATPRRASMPASWHAGPERPACSGYEVGARYTSPAKGP